MKEKELRRSLADYISDGLNIADIKKRYAEKEQEQTKVVSQEAIRKALHRDILQQSRFTSSPSPYGQFR